MARSHSSSSSTSTLNRSSLRDNTYNAIARGRFFLDELLNLPDSPTRPLTEILTPKFFSQVEDNRRWNPTPGPKNFTGSQARVTDRPRRNNYNPFLMRGDLGFVNPERVIRCARRHIRREVIFALNKNKKGSGASRRRRNEWSSVHC